MIDIETMVMKNCVGCYACENICSINCIIMISDEEGFWYPKVDEDKCIKCGKCKDVCPIMNKVHFNNKPIAYSCINKDELIRLASSSGGVFTLLAERVISNGGVVFGAEFNSSFGVEHSHVETQEEIDKFRGSKYVQSKIGDSYKQARDMLESGRSVLFTGTPCQIAGLKSFLDYSYEKLLLCCDIICHGVPSPYVWKKYVEYREEKAGSPTHRIIFRSKEKGWKLFTLLFMFKNNKKYRETVDKDLYMQAFLKDICLRPSCYNCEFKTLQRQSDITLADFWGIQNILPSMDDDKGTSLIFVNSKVGLDIFEQIKKYIIWQEVNINEAVKYNSTAIKSVEPNKKREEFFKELNNLPFNQLVKKYCSDKMFVRLKRKAKAVVYILLEKTCLLDTIKKILKKNGFKN